MVIKELVNESGYVKLSHIKTGDNDNAYIVESNFEISKLYISSGFIFDLGFAEVHYFKKEKILKTLEELRVLKESIEEENNER
jgi:hypothetical protein